MTDEDYFDWWRIARKARQSYPTDKDVELEMVDMPIGFGPQASVVYPGDRMRDRKVIEMFLNEFNHRHRTDMTVDEYLK